MFPAPFALNVQCAILPCLINMLLFVFHLYFYEKKNKNLFLMFSFFTFLFHFDCMGQGGPMFPGRTAHGLQHGWSGLQVWVTFPLPTCALVVCGRGLLDTEVLHCPSVSPSAASAGCGWGGGGCSHSPSGPAYYLCLGLGLLSPGSMDLRPRVCDILISFIDFMIV